MSADEGKYLTKSEVTELAGSVRKFNLIRRPLVEMDAVQGKTKARNSPKEYLASAVHALLDQKSDDGPVHITPEDDDKTRSEMSNISKGLSPNTMDSDPLSGQVNENETVDSAGDTQNMDAGPSEPDSEQPADTDNPSKAEDLPSEPSSSKLIPPASEYQEPGITTGIDDSSTVTKGEPNELDVTKNIQSSGDQPKSGTPDEDTGDAPVGPLQLPLF